MRTLCFSGPPSPVFRLNRLSGAEDPALFTGKWGLDGVFMFS